MSKSAAIIPYATEENIIKWRQEMRNLEYFDGHDNITEKMLKPGAQGKTLRDDFIMRTVTKYMFEFAYNKDEPLDVYYRPANGSAVFKRLPISKKELHSVVVQLYRKFFKITPHSETKSCIDNIMDNITKVADLDNGLWYIRDNTFWDSEKVSIIEKDALAGRCSYREINSTATVDGVDLDLVKDTFDKWTETFSSYGDKPFSDFYKELPRDFEFIKVWAKEGSRGSVDRYWDMCISVSTIFMHIQPPKAYILKGKERNGKSTFVKHLHFLVGRDQTSDIDMPGLADWSFNNSLYGSLLNAPDEDPAEKLNHKATAAFKTLAAKEIYRVPVKNSPRPKMIKPHFMMFIPKNDLPSFSGDSTPCLTRLRFIFFINDLSLLDNKPKDFIKETFVDNPKLLSEYVGFVLSLSKYFSEHEMWYSPTMEASSDYVAESVNSTRLYYKAWKTFYVGYESFDLLWQDYVNFCKSRSYKMETQEMLRQTFFQEGQNRQKRYYAGSKKDIWMYLSGDTYTTAQFKLGKLILCRDDYIEGYGAASRSVMEDGFSFVDIRNKIAEEALTGFSSLGGEK